MGKLAAKHNPFAQPGVRSATFMVGAENTGTGAIVVAIQLKDANGADMTVRSCVPFYLSDDANGDSVIATAHSGAVAAGTDGLARFITAKKDGFLTSEADGDIDFSMIEAGAKTAYLVLVMPDGSLAVSGAITHAT